MKKSELKQIITSVILESIYDTREECGAKGALRYNRSGQLLNPKSIIFSTDKMLCKSVQIF